MIAAALLMAAQAGTHPNPVPEIVVLGNLRALQVSVGQDPQGRWHCSMSRSTGRASLDDAFCRAVTKCLRQSVSDKATAENCIIRTRGKLVRQIERAMKRNSR